MKRKRVTFGRGGAAVAVLMLVLMTSLLWGASGAFAASSSPSAVSAADALALRVGWAAEPNTLNPFRQNLICEFELTHLNYDYLVGVDAATYAPKPELATSWSHSADGLTWTFKTREGVKWQDGVDFTARDVAFTFNYIIKNDLSAFSGPFTGGIKNVTATDDSTAVFHLSKPWALMLRMYVPILPEHIWSKISPTAATTKFQNSNPVGTGPFQTVSFQTGQSVTMQANKSYWRGAPKVDEVVFQSYQNPNSMGDELKAGAIDVAWGIPNAQFKQLSTTSGITAVAGLRKGFEELGFNCYNGGASLGNPVLRDWKFRQALNYAVDKQTILNTGWMGYGSVATSVIQPGYFKAPLDYHWEPSASEAYTFDLAKAGDMLTAAGYPLKNGVRLNKQGKPITLRLVARANSPEGQRSGKLLASWFSKLGLKMQYQVMDESALLAKMYNYEGSTFKPDYDLFLWDWVGAGVDPNYILGVFTTVQIGNLNDSCYSNPAYDKLYSQQQTTIDEAQRLDVVWKMQQMLYQQSPYIPLVYARNLEAYNTAKWTGWVQSPAGQGGVIYNADNIDTYLSVTPVAGASTSSSSSSSSGLIVIVVVVVVAVVAIVAFTLLRRRSRQVED
jgi:peptide/nickel transport system substrate-binding protein